MTTGTRKPGEFCWINMLTPRPAQACAFFGEVLGWTCSEIPGMGYSVKAGGRDIGGLFDLAGPNTPAGLPPYIGVMVKIESADATCAKVVSLGGSAKPAFDIMDRGRMVVCFDPNGASMMRIASEMEIVRPHWATYFTVLDADEAARTDGSRD